MAAALRGLGRAQGIRGYHDIKRYPDARRVPGLVLFRWDAPLFFANAELFRERILEAVAASPTPVKRIIVAAEPSDAENAPDFRVHVLDTMSNETGAEIGAGWKRTGEKAGDYVSLQLDDPTFDHPIRANLFQSADDKSAWSLHWNRPPKRGERD